MEGFFNVTTMALAFVLASWHSSCGCAQEVLCSNCHDVSQILQWNDIHIWPVSRVRQGSTITEGHSAYTIAERDNINVITINKKHQNAYHRTPASGPMPKTRLQMTDPYQGNIYL